MDTKALEKFCPWARVELIDAVHLRCVRYALDDAGRADHPADADVVAGTVLAPSEKTQRAALFERIERLNEERGGKGYAAFCEQQAYSWFNRFAAIRYMELHGYLSNNVRMLSAGNGALEPECLRMASELDLPGLELTEVLDLITAGDDEALFRRILVAQMNELADCLPTVFGHVDDADALTLPDNLLAHGEHDVLFHLVADIPEEAWGDVEVLGWMYQFYNSELKDAFFKSKRKAAAEDLAPATQLFTPDWIVRYMVENSLGRLWMLNNPGSRLREDMAYFIEPDAQHEDFIRIEGPEDITFCDPACGSGHILVYAFSLLFEMYAERGYRERDIPQLILGKNLSGMEIDERAAQIASLVLAMCAREHDRRFFTRSVTADICVLESVTFDESSLPRVLKDKKDLMETLAHLSEIGSLYTPNTADLVAVDKAISELSDASLFGAATLNKLCGAKAQLNTLSRSFDVVAANPPYMTSANFSSFLNSWVRRKFPSGSKDLYACFIERCRLYCSPKGYTSLVTMQGWLFLSSFEKLRNEVLQHSSIESLIHCGTRCFAFTSPGTHDLVSAVAFVLRMGRAEGSFTAIDLNHIRNSGRKEGELLRLVRDPSEHTFIVNQTSFSTLPGLSFAYWVNEGAIHAFNTLPTLSKYSSLQSGFTSGDNARFFRLWWEVGFDTTSLSEYCQAPVHTTKPTWFPITNGGQFRRWYGNQTTLALWKNNGYEMKNCGLKGTAIGDTSSYFDEGISWGRISAVDISFRYTDAGSIPEHASGMVYPADKSPNTRFKLLGLLNSTSARYFFRILSPTVNLTQGPVGALPIPDIPSEVEDIAIIQTSLSRADWDTQETSWDFKRNPLI